MSDRRPFRFGLTADGATDGVAWRALCREAEDLGFSSLMVCDHLGPQWGLVPAMAAALEAAPSLRVGALVACNDYRHPVMYAKELATLDVLSGGRTEWGIGAGWLSTEYEQAGLPFDPGPTRAERTIEAVRVMRGLFGDGALTHEGRHYRVAGLDGQPKPVQRPHPPLLVGAASRRLLSFAAREADIVGVGPSWASLPALAGPDRPTAPEAADDQLGWIRAAAGPRLDEIELNMVAFPFVVTDDRQARAAQLAQERGVGADEVLASPHVLLGTVDELCDALEERRARWGVSYWVLPAQARRAAAPVVARLAGR